VQTKCITPLESYTRELAHINRRVDERNRYLIDMDRYAADLHKREAKAVGAPDQALQQLQEKVRGATEHYRVANADLIHDMNALCAHRDHRLNPMLSVFLNAHARYLSVVAEEFSRLAQESDRQGLHNAVAPPTMSASHSKLPSAKPAATGAPAPTPQAAPYGGAPAPAPQATPYGGAPVPTGGAYGAGAPAGAAGSQFGGAAPAPYGAAPTPYGAAPAPAGGYGGGAPVNTPYGGAPAGAAYGGAPAPAPGGYPSQPARQAPAHPAGFGTVKAMYDFNAEESNGRYPVVLCCGHGCQRRGVSSLLTCSDSSCSG
jgi:BAR domain